MFLCKFTHTFLFPPALEADSSGQYPVHPYCALPCGWHCEDEVSLLLSKFTTVAAPSVEPAVPCALDQGLVNYCPAPNPALSLFFINKVLLETACLFI